MTEAEFLDQHGGVIVESLFVRDRNVLMTRADFSALYVDYYLHVNDCGVTLTHALDEQFKTALAAFTLHCASHPRNEVLSWTINFQNPLVNVFLAGDTNEAGKVVGRIFDEDVKRAAHNAFYQDLVRPNKPLHRSYVEFTGSDPLIAAECFYDRSEQRPARYFQTAGDKYVMVSAHPDYDEAWFRSITLDDVISLQDNETVSLLEKRHFRWECGCNEQKLLRVLLPLAQSDNDELFQGEESVYVNCPRCWKKYIVTRERMDAYIAQLQQEAAASQTAD